MSSTMNSTQTENSRRWFGSLRLPRLAMLRVAGVACLLLVGIQVSVASAAPSDGAILATSPELPDPVSESTIDGTDGLMSPACSNGVAVASTTSGSTSSASSVTVSHTTSGTDRLMLVGVTWNKDGGTNRTGVTYGGVALTQVLETNNGAEVYSEIWRLTNPTLGTANVVATLNGSSKGMVVGVMTFNNVHQTTPLGTAVQGNGDASSSTISVGSTSGGLVMDTIGVKLRTPTLPGGSGQTERWSINSGGENRGAGSTEPGTGSNVGMAWSWAGGSEKYAHVGVGINACPLSRIGAAKDLVSITHLGSNVYRVVYDVLVENFGSTSLTSVQLSDNLDTTFTGPATFSLVSTSIQSGGLTLNGSYTGTPPNINLLSGANTLTAGSSGVVRITVDVDSMDTSGSYPNSATATGTRPDSVAITDLSQDGTDPDPDNDNDPTDNNVATPLNFGPTAITLQSFGASSQSLPDAVHHTVRLTAAAVVIGGVVGLRRSRRVRQ